MLAKQAFSIDTLAKIIIIIMITIIIIINRQSYSKHR